MKWKKQLLTLLYLITITFLAFPQPNTDSLKLALNSKSGEEKIEIYEQLIKNYKQSDPDQAIIYCKALIAFADSSGNTKAMALGYREMGLIYERQRKHELSLQAWKANVEIEKNLNNRKNIAYSTMAVGNSLQNLARYDEAMVYFGETQKILEEIDDLRGQGFNYGNMGIAYENMGLKTEAVDAKLKSLQIAEQLGDSTKIASSLGSIAISQTNLREYQKAIDNYTKAIEIYERIGKSANVVHTLANLGVAYKSLDENQKSIECFKKGLALSKEINYPYGRAIVLMNFGETLLDINQPDSALFYLMESNKIFTELNMQHPLCYNYKVMGKWYKEAGNTERAIEYLEKAYELSQKINAPDQHRDVAYYLSEIYEAKGDYRKALQFQKSFKHYSDSLFNAENVAETTRLESQYQFEKEQTKTELLHQAEISKKQTILILVIAGLVAVFTLLVLLFFEYRRKNAAYKALYHKNLEIMQKNTSRKKGEVLRNGDLFIEIERMMREDKLFMQKDLSRDTFKNLLETNHEYVQQAIKDHAGKTVSDYISNWRIEEAMNILTDPEKFKNKTMLNISDEIGLSATSPTTFYTLFKKFTGMTPIQFQKQSQK